MDTKVTMPEGAVGDVNSTEKGSGARFNAGKAPFDLVPVRVIQHYLRANRLASQEVIDAFGYLAHWQEEGRSLSLLLALNVLGPEGMAESAHVFDYGRKKYSEWNWAKGMAWSIPLACAIRHLLAIAAGEENDKESGLPHRGHFICNVAMLLTFENTFPEGDDRPRTLSREKKD